LEVSDTYTFAILLSPFYYKKQQPVTRIVLIVASLYVFTHQRDSSSVAWERLECASERRTGNVRFVLRCVPWHGVTVSLLVRHQSACTSVTLDQGLEE